MAKTLKSINDEIKKLMRSVKIRNTKLKKNGLENVVEVPELKLGKTLREAKEIHFKAESYLRRTSSNVGIRKATATGQRVKEEKLYKKSPEYKVHRSLREINKKLGEFQDNNLGNTKGFRKLVNTMAGYGIIINNNQASLDLKGVNKSDYKKLMREMNEISDNMGNIEQALRDKRSDDRMFNVQLKRQYGLEDDLSDREITMAKTAMGRLLKQEEYQQLTSKDIQEIVTKLKNNFNEITDEMFMEAVNIAKEEVTQREIVDQRNREIKESRARRGITRRV